MEKKMTMIKLLLLIPAFLFGYMTYAQKSEPVKTGSSAIGVKVDPAVSNVKASSWKLEQDVVSGLENMSAEPAPSIQPQPASAAKSTAELEKELKNDQEAKRLAAIEKVKMETGGDVDLSAAKLPSSPNTMWDILFNVGIGPNMWYGIETDGSYLYGTLGPNSDFNFAKHSLNGTLIEQFNIPGIPNYGSPNYSYLRDMCYDGQYWYAILYGSTTSGTKIYKFDLVSKTLISSFDLPFSYGYHLTFDQDLNNGFGGFWCGSSTSIYSLDLAGNVLSGPTSLPYSAYASATDKYSEPGSTYLWFYTTTGYTLRQFNPNTMSYTGVTHSILDLTPPGITYAYCYGLSDSKIYSPGRLVLLGSYYYYDNITYASIYKTFGYELGYTVQYPTDAGVKAIVEPVNGYNLGNSVVVKAMIRNNGTLDITNIPLKFSVNGVDSPTEVFATTIPGGTEQLYTFTATADMHYFNNYNICVTTMYPGDQFALNDVKCKVVKNDYVQTANIYPALAPRNTGAVTGPTGFPPETIISESLIKYKSGSKHSGWAKFPLDNVTLGDQILSVRLKWFVDSTNNAYYKLTRLTSDPVTASGSTLWNEISTGYFYNTTQYTQHGNEGWQTDSLGGAQAKADILAAVNAPPGNQWWAVGFWEHETYYSTYWAGNAHGWNEPNKPYLEIRSVSTLPSDVGVFSILIEPFALANAPYSPQAKVKNYGTTDETFTVTMTGPGGYSSTKTLYLAHGDDSIVTFDPGLFPVSSNAVFTCCASLTADLNLFNQCLSKSTVFDAVLTRAYGYIVNPISSTNGLAEGTCKFFLEHPDYVSQISPTPITAGGFIASGTWGKSPSNADVWYVTSFYDAANPAYADGGKLYTVNTSTGAYNLVGELGVNINGLSFDYTTNKLYGIGSVAGPVGNYATTLYEINRTTGQAVLFANLGYTTGIGVNLACNASGALYFIDATVDRLFAIDPFTSEKESIGSTIVNINSAQDMEFNRTTGKLLLAGYTNAYASGALFTEDLSTGVVTQIKNFPSGLEMTGFAIPYTHVAQSKDVGLMMMKYPKTGNLTSNESVIVKIRNYGSNDMTDCKISYQKGNGAVITEQWSNFGLNPLTPGEWIDYSFSTQEDLSDVGATWCFKSWVWDVNGDTNQINDTVAKCVNNTACILATPCYPNSIQETELCSEDANGGCNSEVPAYIELSNGSSYCGSVWKSDTLRDTDWYKFSLTSLKAIKIIAKGEFNFDINVVKLPCSSDPIIASKSFIKCNVIGDSLITPNLLPGEYAIVIAPNFFEYDIICGFSNKYSFKYIVMPPQYCKPSAGTYTGNDEYIQNVTVGSINNTTGFTPGGYADYTYLNTYMETGDTIPVSVFVATYWSSDYTSVYIDWNGDFTFNTTDERFPLTGNGDLNPGQLYTGNIIVPTNLAPGPRIMRVRMVFAQDPPLPCSEANYSEGEDYSVYIIAPVPTIVTTIGSLNEPCPGIKTVPVDVQEFNNVQQMYLKMEVTPGMVLTSNLTNLDLNPALCDTCFFITQSGNEVIATYYSATPAFIGTGKLFDLQFSCPSGTNQINWITGPDGSKYSNSVMGNLHGTWVGSTLTFGNCNTLTGKTWYAKKTPQGANIPVTMGNPGSSCSDVAVYLSRNDTILDTVCPDAFGNFSFPELANGTYKIKAASFKPWGGVNAGDAQYIMRNYVNLNGFALTGIHLIAAEIDGKGSKPNATDALLVTRRYAMIIPSFLPPYVNPGRPDWASESHTIVINGTANQYKDIMMLCTGDVNGSFNPAPPMKNSVVINNETSINVEGDVIDLPIYAGQDMNVGSVSLVLSYPANLEIMDVRINQDADNLVYNVLDGQLRMGWFSLDPIQLKAGEVLATLSVKVTNLNGSAEFTTNTESALTDGECMPIDDASLIIPKLVSDVQASDYSLSNVPNPFSATTQIRYTLPKSGNISLKVYNVLGEEISTLFDGEQAAGSHTVNFDGTTLARGVYMYKLKAGDVTKVKTMVVTD